MITDECKFLKFGVVIDHNHMKHFCTLKITNMSACKSFKVISDSFSVVGIYVRGTGTQR
jgi:hypothetical protein